MDCSTVSFDGLMICFRAIRTVFNDEEGLILANYPTDNLKQTIVQHFRLMEFEDILGLLYGEKFSKGHIASVTSKIAQRRDKRVSFYLLLDAETDPLCKQLFEAAGEHLARHLVAISKNFDQVRTIRRQ